MRGKRILFVSPALANGGIEQLARQWEDAVKKHGHTYVFAVLNYGGDTFDYFKSLGYKIYILKTVGDIGVVGFVKQYYKLIKAERIDVIHIPASPTSALALFAAMCAGCKNRIIHAHTNLYNTLTGKKWSGLKIKQFQWMNIFFSTTRLTGSSAAADYCFGRGCKDTILIKNGIDLDKFVFSNENRNKLRKNLNIENDFVIGSVGRLTYQKNQGYVIDICKSINSQGTICKLLILGEGEDEIRLKKKVEELELEDKVFFLGVTDDLSQFYNAMDAFVFPSRFEGLGIAAVEAQSCGTACYLSEYVPKDAIITEQTRVISISEDPSTWAKMILKDGGQRNMKGVEEARKAGYDRDRTISQLLDVYEGKYV